jgi:ribosomal-protein-alanine N-acetyltransferase
VSLIKLSMLTPRYILRPIDSNQDDLSGYLSWMQDEKSNPFIQSVRNDYSLSELIEYIQKKNSSPNVMLLGIFCAENGKHIGNLKFEPILFTDRRAVLGLLIGDPEFRGIGVGTEILPYVFSKLCDEYGIELVELGVDSDNKAALALYKKMGFGIKSSYGDCGLWMSKYICKRTE